MTTNIRIDDLRRPVLTDAHRQALKHAEDHAVELTQEAVLTAARQATGLNDFGPDDFRARLQLWLDETAHAPNLTALARQTVFQRCVKYAEMRLRLQDLLRRHPEIREMQIQRPIIVVGPFRSGTTHLVNLIAKDSRLRSLPMWECSEPIPGPGETPTQDGLDPRLARYAKASEQTRALLPHLAAMRPLDPGDVDEETDLQGPDFATGWWKSTALVRDWRDYSLDKDQTPHYEYMKTILKALQWQRGPDRWVLKSVHHAEQLGPLLATFPDATIVMTHRDPVAIVQSVATLAAYLARLEYDKVDVEAIVGYWAQRIESLLRAIVRDRNVVPENRLIDVLFHEFMADEFGEVERIYTTAGLELTDAQRSHMAAFLEEHPRDKHGQVAYDLRADFGVNPAELRARFAFYYEYFPVRIEVQ